MIGRATARGRRAAPTGPRVGFVDNLCDPATPGAGGHSDIVWEMAARLHRLGTTVSVVGPYTTEAYPDRGVRVHRWRAPWPATRNALTLAAVAFQGAHHLDAHVRPRIAHVTDAFSAGMAGLRVRAPIVFSVSGSVFQRLATGNPLDPTATAAYVVVSKIAARRVSRVIATSRDMAYWWRRAGTPADRISIIPLGVDVARFHRREVGRPSVVPTLLYVGRLAPENDPLLLADVAAGLHRRGASFRLLVVGSGPLETELRRRVDALGVADVVEWNPGVTYDALPALYSSADAFVYPRRGGAPPRVVIQALACGLPVAAFAAAGVDDYVMSGETGILGRVGDVEALTEAAHALVADGERRRAMGRAAELAARDRFDWDRVVARIDAEIYRPLLAASWCHPALGRAGHRRGKRG